MRQKVIIMRQKTKIVIQNCDKIQTMTIKIMRKKWKLKSQLIDNNKNYEISHNYETQIHNSEIKWQNDVSQNWDKKKLETMTVKIMR